MNIYPNLNISGGNDFGHEKDDGRDASRAEDGTARVQILFPVLQHTFSVQHDHLNKAEQKTIDDFYTDNAALEFIYDCPFNDKRYQCIFLSPPQPTNHVGLFCSLVVKFTGHELQDTIT